MRGFDLSPPEPGIVDDMVIGDLLDTRAVAEAVDGVDRIEHLAALMSWRPSDVRRLFEINVTGTHCLLQAASTRGVERFVLASSGEVYPDLDPQYSPIDEEHPTRPNTPYGVTKYLAEQMVKVAAARGLEVCILRFAHTQAADELLDPEGSFSGPRFFVAPKLRQLRGLPRTPPVAESIARLEEVKTGGRDHLYIGCDRKGRPYRMAICDVRDLVQGVLLALVRDAAAGETFNIGPPAGFDFDQAVGRMSDLTGLPVARVRLATAPYRYDTSIEKAVSMLGYEPRYTILDMIEEAAAAGVA